MKLLIQTIDPLTYGFNRSPIIFGIIVIAVAAVVVSKLLNVLHAAGLPSVQ